MAFTGVLGTVDSYPANFALGFYDTTPAGPNTPASNVLNLTQTLGRSIIYDRSVTSTLSLSGSVKNIIEGVADNTLSITQTATAVKLKIKDVAQTFSPSQTVTVQKIYNLSVISTLVPTQILSRKVVKAINITNSLTLTQTDTGVASKLAINTATFSSVLDAFVAKGAKNVLSLDQLVGVNTVLNRRTFSNFIPFQIVILGPNTFRRDVLSTLGFSQTITVAKVKDVRQLLTFTQTVDANVSKLAQNTLDLTQTVNVNISYNRGVIDSLAMTSGSGKSVSKAAAAVSILAFEQFVKGKFVHNISLTHNITFGQDLVRERVLKSLISTLNLDQTADAFKIAPRSITQTLNFSQTVNVNINYVRAASNNLSFVHGRNKYIGLGDLSEIFVPEAIGVKVKSLVVLYGPDKAITLPAPEFQDGDEFQGKLNVIRFEGGSKRIYRKNSEKYKLTYEFTLDYHKIRELKLFIQAYNSRSFKMDNHRGEIWQVIFASNPFEITEASYWADSCGNKFIIPLEFEGVRVN